MNIRDRKILAAFMILLGYACALTSCHREDNPAAPLQTDIPILMSASSEWPELTKVPVIGEENIDGEEIDYRDLSFYVWGYYEPSPENLVFDGTEVYYVTDIWTYDGPAKYWSIGNYSFAAIMSAEALGNSVSCSFDEGVATFAFDPAYNLLEEQHDVMFALDEPEFTVDDMNSNDEKAVTFNFGPQLSMLSFTIQNNITSVSSAITVISIEVAGLHSSAASWSGGVWTYDGDPSSCSLDVSENVSENLLVFPEVDTPITVYVTYTEILDGVENPTPEITKSTAPFEVTLEKGKRYTYPLTISNSEIILFDEPSVTPWPDEATEVGNITVK